MADEFTAGETLHVLAELHDISQQLIQTWVGKFEAGALDDVGRVQPALTQRLTSLLQTLHDIGRSGEQDW